MIVLGGLGLAITVYLLARAISSGIEFELELLLSGLFVLVGAYAYLQTVRHLAGTGGRVSLLQAVRRVYYDASRVYSHAGILTQIGTTTAVAAVVGSATLAPVVFPRDPGFILFGYGTDNALYRIEPTTGAASPLQEDRALRAASPLALLPSGLRLPNERRTPPGSLAQLVSMGNGTGLVVVNPRTGQRVPVARFDRPLDAVGLTIDRDGRILVLERSGTLWQAGIDGSLTRLGSVGRPVDAATWNLRSKTFSAISGGALLTIDPVSLAVQEVAVLPELQSAQVCGLAFYAGRFMIADASTGQVILVSPQHRVMGTIGAADPSTRICGLVAIPR
jgi:hypothetical protein